MVSLFDAIVIREPQLTDRDAWDQNLEIVRLLCEQFVVTKWLNQKGGNPYIHIPEVYVCEGIEIEFLPHWGFYNVGCLGFNRPTNIESVLKTVDIVKQLVNLGYKPENHGWTGARYARHYRR